jgi:transcriptional regulator
MYAPAPYAETDPEVIAELIARARLGVLVTHGPEGLFATHLPWLHDRDEGVLYAHLARVNPHRSLAGDGEALVVFSGIDAYVSPSWYPSKAVDGRQVPTWNYEAVHVYGRLAWIDDRDALSGLVERLSDRHEAGRSEPWRVSDAPADYVERLLRGVVGVRLRITRAEAKRKLGQTKSGLDRAGVIAALDGSSDPRDRAVAEAMRRLP